MNQQASRFDVWLWAIIASALLGLRVFPAFAPALDQDSFQYLFAAQGALSDHVGYTSLIHYDVERSFGTVPAPLLTFPLGYPLAIAALSLTGMTPPTAALLLSMAATIGCVALMAWIGARLGLSRTVRNMMIACFVLNGVVSEFGTAAMTEALFTFMVMLGMALLFAARTDEERPRTGLWIAAGLAFGAAYFVRFAGLFFIFGVSLLAARHALARDRQLVKGHLLTLAFSVLLVMVGVLRNLRFVGNWRGRDEMLAQTSALTALKSLAGGLNALFLGVGTGAGVPGGTFVAKAALCLFVALGLALLAWRHAQEAVATPSPDLTKRRIGQDLLILALTYCACMFYVGLTREISFGLARNFVPLVPMAVLLFGALLQALLPASAAVHRGAASRAAVGALALGFCCYAYLNLLAIRLPLNNQTAVIVDRIGPPGAAGRETILKEVGPRGVILANNGQAVGYVLGTPTISMVGHTFGGLEWNEATVRETIRRFGISALVISAPIPGNPIYDEIPSPFVGQLIEGKAPPWLHLEYHDKGVLVYAPVDAAEARTASRSPA